MIITIDTEGSLRDIATGSEVQLERDDLLGVVGWVKLLPGLLHPNHCLPPDLLVLVSHHGDGDVLQMGLEGVSFEDTLSCLAVSGLWQVM